MTSLDPTRAAEVAALRARIWAALLEQIAHLLAYGGAPPPIATPSEPLTATAPNVETAAAIPPAPRAGGGPADDEGEPSRRPTPPVRARAVAPSLVPPPQPDAPADHSRAGSLATLESGTEDVRFARLRAPERAAAEAARSSVPVAPTTPARAAQTAPSPRPGPPPPLPAPREPRDHAEVSDPAAPIGGAASSPMLLAFRGRLPRRHSASARRAAPAAAAPTASALGPRSAPRAAPPATPIPPAALATFTDAPGAPSLDVAASSDPAELEDLEENLGDVLERVALEAGIDLT